ncbi:MAG: glycosyltransferase family 2 protein [Thermoanaerobaculia bacterium]|nr:glycosyltransferase family 2 protein [Thermoanaerobaculia bacterium]
MGSGASQVVAVLPAFDCERTVGAVVRPLCALVGRVIVVSDGSRDATAEVARAAGAEVERLPENRGKGFALRRGLELALAGGPAAVALLDADGQHDPADLPGLIRAWRDERFDLVIGTRLQDRETSPPARFWTNYIGSRVLSWMTGRELLDSQSGYRLLSAPLAARLPLRADGYAIESEMLIKAAARGARIGHVPIRTIYNDGGSHFQPLLDTFRISCASVYFKVFDEA